MKYVNFNTLIIIESLRDNEAKTGTSLYQDLKNYEYLNPKLNIRLETPTSISEWDQLMNSIINECRTNQLLPMLHLELHGGEDCIQFSNGETKSLLEVTNQFREINSVIGCNLFLTLGVCKGLYCLLNTSISKPMPYCGVVGSFDDITAGDIELRFHAFYEELFTSFDISNSILCLYKENSVADNKYRYIPIDEIFYKCYHEYLTNNCTKDAVKKRADDSIQEYNIDAPTRQVKRKFEREFAKQEKKKRYEDYCKAASIFFMLNQFQENKSKFEIPETFDELKQRYETLIV